MLRNVFLFNFVKGLKMTPMKKGVTVLGPLTVLYFTEACVSLWCLSVAFLCVPQPELFKHYQEKQTQLRLTYVCRRPIFMVSVSVR